MPQEDAKIWAGSLCAYNEGCLVGVWLSLDDYDGDTEALETAAREYVTSKAPKGRADEWTEELWVFDHECLPITGECSISGAMDAFALAQEFAEAAGLDYDDACALMRSGIENPEAIRGIYSRGSDEDVVAEYLEDAFSQDELPGWAQGSYDAILRDLARSAINGGELHVEELPDGRRAIIDQMI